jgi:hypothetical protein
VIANTQTLIFPVQFNTYKRVTRNAPEGSGFSEKDYVRADEYLHRAAALSGLGIYPAQNISDLEGAVAKIIDELHNEYSVGYYPRTPIRQNENRRVEVTTRYPQLVTRSRTSYALFPTGTVTRFAPHESIAPNEIGARPFVRDLKETTRPVDERWICKATNISTEFVVVKEGFDGKCPNSTRPNDETNAWLIRRPHGNEVMCKGFMKWQGREIVAAPIPTGYVVTAATTSPSCSRSIDPDDNSNAWIIRRPSGSDKVCKGFPLPRGFVMVSEVVIPGCPERPGGLNGWTIRQK